MQERTILPANEVSLRSDQTFPVGPGALVKQENQSGNDQVQVVREGDQIRMIVVTCECGKQIRIACEY